VENMTIKMLRKQDYSKVIDFAITGMHFDWYMSSKFILEAYGRYFLYMELNRATQIIAAYEGDKLAGVLLAEIKGEKPAQYSFFRNVYVKVFNWLQHIFAGGAVGDYDEANKKMLADYKSRVKAIPHRTCAEDAPTDFSSDRIEIPQAYWSVGQPLCQRC
jgi:hypothetical protein